VVIMTKDKTNAEEGAIMQAALSLLVKAARHEAAVKALYLLAAAKNGRDFASIEAAARTTSATSPTPAAPVGAALLS
jgi:hypothetical protein